MRLQAPASAVEGAGDSGYLDSLPLSEHWMQYLWLAAIGVGGLIALSLVRPFLCPEEGSRLITGFVASLQLLVGAALLMARSSLPHAALVAVEVEAFLGEAALYTMLGVGALLLLVGLATLSAMFCRSRTLLRAILAFWARAHIYARAWHVHVHVACACA